MVPVRGAPSGHPGVSTSLRTSPRCHARAGPGVLSQTGCQSGPVRRVRRLAGARSRTSASGCSGRSARSSRAGCKGCGGDLGVADLARRPVQLRHALRRDPRRRASGLRARERPPSSPARPTSARPPWSRSPPPSGVPSATPGPAPSGAGAGSGGTHYVESPNQGARTSPGKANYEAYHPFYRDSHDRQARSGARPKTLDASPEPTTRSAQGSSRRRLPTKPTPSTTFPCSISRSTSPRPITDAPVPSAAAATAAPLRPPRPWPISPRSPPPPRCFGRAGHPTVRGRRIEARRGQSAHTDGLDWLSEKGYKTILDLREDADISPAFISEVTRRGMR